jgi:hypothetical protein
LCFLEPFLVDIQTVFFRHETGEISRKAISVVESPHERSVNSLCACGLGFGKILLKKTFSAIESASKRDFLFIQNTCKVILFLCDFGKNVTLMLANTQADNHTT